MTLPSKPPSVKQLGEKVEVGDKCLRGSSDPIMHTAVAVIQGFSWDKGRAMSRGLPPLKDQS